MNVFASKPRLALLPFLFGLLALAAFAANAKKPAKEPDNRPVLAIIITGNLQNEGSAWTDFDRLDIAFHKVAEQRKWPVKLVVDRMAGGVPDYETQLMITSFPVRQETFADLVYRAWTKLVIKGTETNFKIVTYTHHPRLGRNMNDTLDEVFLGYANKVADLIEPILFPKIDKPAPAKP